MLCNGHDATTNDVFAKAMVVGASCPRCVRYGGCHPRRITCTSENLNDIEAAALANKKFRMSSFAAGLALPPVIPASMESARISLARLSFWRYACSRCHAEAA